MLHRDPPGTGLASLTPEAALMYRPDQHFVHYKGGIYRYLFEARSADNGEPVVVYLHLGPHQPEIWVRRKSEFFSYHEDKKLRFDPIGADVAKHRVATTRREHIDNAVRAALDVIGTATPPKADPVEGRFRRLLRLAGLRGRQ